MIYHNIPWKLVLLSTCSVSISLSFLLTPPGLSLDPPDITFISSGDAITNGSHIIINCTFDANPFVYSVVWTHNGSQLDASDHSHIDINTQSTFSELIFSSFLQGDDSGDYVCNVTNSIGYRESSVVQLIGICESETILDDSKGQFDWLRTPAQTKVNLTCPNGPFSAVASRTCSNDSIWISPDTTNCGTVVTVRFRELADSIAETNVTIDNFQFVTENLTVIVANATDNGDQNIDNLRVVSNVLTQIAALFSNPATFNTLTPVEVAMTTENTVRILDNVEEWTPIALETESNQILQSFETITDALVTQENFTNVTIITTDIAFKGERIQRTDYTAITFSAFLLNDMLNIYTQVGQNGDKFLDTQISEVATISLPESILNITNDENVNLALTVYNQAALFPSRDPGNFTAVGSSVIGASVGGVPDGTQLDDPVTVVLAIRNPFTGIFDENITNPRCVFWNFTAAGGQGNWSTTGCTTIANDSNLSTVSCSCDHLTNFACLVDISARTDDPMPSNVALEIVTIVGISLSLLGLILTVVTLIIFKELRKRDSSKFHIQLCIALFCMSIVFISGIDRVSPEAGCITVGVLIHYFALVTWMWMAAEALLMFQKLVIVFSNITWRYLLVVSIICWTIPLIPVIVTVVVNPDNYIRLYDGSTPFEPAGFCFIGNLYWFLGAFLILIFLIISFNFVIYIFVIRVLIVHTVQKNKRLNKPAMLKAVKIFLSLSGIMVLFCLNWLFAVFTFITAPEVSFIVQFFFSFFNAFQGFFVFLFFVVLNSDSKAAWKSLLCSLTQKDQPTSKLYLSSSNRKTYTGTENKSISLQRYFPQEKKYSIDVTDREKKLREKENQSIFSHFK